MNLIEALKNALAKGFKTSSMDGGYGRQEFQIEELISDLTTHLNNSPDEDNINADSEYTDYILDTWILDAEAGRLERTDYKGMKTGCYYELHKP